jgi:hypothetical protein
LTVGSGDDNSDEGGDSNDYDSDDYNSGDNINDRVLLMTVVM